MLNVELSSIKYRGAIFEGVESLEYQCLIIKCRKEDSLFRSFDN